MYSVELLKFEFSNCTFSIFSGAETIKEYGAIYLHGRAEGDIFNRSEQF